MSKLDGIQERIRLIERHQIQSPCETEILDLLRHITAELKRIDADVQQVKESAAQRRVS